MENDPTEYPRGEPRFWFCEMCGVKISYDDEIVLCAECAALSDSDLDALLWSTTK